MLMPEKRMMVTTNKYEDRSRKFLSSQYWNSSLKMNRKSMFVEYQKIIFWDGR